MTPAAGSMHLELEMVRDGEVAKRALVEMEEAAYRYLAQGLQQVCSRR